jgi:hypothetical protein
VKSLQALHPRGVNRFHDGELDERWQSELHHNLMIDQINQDYLGDEE